MTKQLELKAEEHIAPCIWYQSETMLAMTTSPCNSCGGYRRECVESRKYFPREDKETLDKFLEKFKERWGHKYKR